MALLGEAADGQGPEIAKIVAVRHEPDGISADLDRDGSE
jgi:hypothetical protein